ncbi:hypothetical protein C8J56DRAFT_927422 [Mycena floridula]|nr:hypothetical protein C8J56DRAFT_927422 [Mycena floridula]
MTATARDALWATGHDETVEVNQRALIDKVLARYSGEFTVFRELLQNSDDAQSKAVEIRFESQQYLDHKAPSGQPLPDLKTALVHQWSFKNNGIPFRDEDWARLKKIAEGNPDEEKIGAFGVGFYSLFSVTEEPFVTSGGQWMGFYWKDKKDQLFARRGSMPDSDQEQALWTSFEMKLREPAPIPVAFDFTRFLASSITFMAHLCKVSVFLDDKRLVVITKESGTPKELGLPKGLRSTSVSGIMSVKKIQSTPLYIKAEVMRYVYTSGTEKPPTPSATRRVPAPQGGFFSSLLSSFAGGSTPQRSATPLPPQEVEVVDPLTVNETSVTLSIFSAEADVRLNKKVAAELLRSTKKKPPPAIKYELIYTAKDEYDASKKEDEALTFATGSIFQGLRADLEGTGSARVFIGHATGQTTGLGGHMAARFIPTVERESIDLMDRNVAIWNKELLFVGGYLARAAYNLEMANISNLWQGASTALSGPPEELQNWLLRRAIHSFKFFTFYHSTPSPEVSSLLEIAFFECSQSDQFPVVSTTGVVDASKVRMPDPVFAAFLKGLPVLHEDMLSNARPMITSLQNRGLIKPITFDDILTELRSRPLTEPEMIACLNWWTGAKHGENPRFLRIRDELLQAAVLTIGDVGSERIIPLSSIVTFINLRSFGAQIPLNGPLPDHLLPTTISKEFQPEQLSSAFPWKELNILDWIQHICNPAVRSANVEFDLNVSPPWAEQVLNVLVRVWPSLSNDMKTAIQQQMKTQTCIPTTNGMKVPEEAYFSAANIFHDLPVVKLPSTATIKSATERVLHALGVRKHVELQVVFNRMIKTNEWSAADLVKYLVSVKSTLSAEELERLKMTSVFFQEALSSEDATNRKRLKARDLYEPLPIFRELQLPVIDWGTQHKWRGSSEEAKFLFNLGLRKFPPLSVLIQLCASPDANRRAVALKYLVDNISSEKYNDYDPAAFSEIAYIPALKDGKPCLGTPKTVVAHSDWATFGLLVVPPTMPLDTVARLKIRQHPPSALLVSLLEKSPPKDEAEAKRWFGILATQISSFTPAELTRLSNLAMVPTRRAKAEQTTPLVWLPPTQCFFGGDSKATFHSKLFVFVDFGTVANNFLSACGTKHEPSVEEIVQMLLADPRKFYSLSSGPTEFFGELRNIAVNSRNISSGTMARMKKSAILLGSQRKALNEKTSTVDPEEDDYDLQYDLKRPDEIVIADDSIAYQFFGQSIFTAPQEDILEDFYLLLGSRRLSSLIKQDHKSSNPLQDSKSARDIRALVLERLPLFLHEHTHAKTKVSYSWLNTPANFKVTAYGKLSVTKSLNFGSTRLERSQETSAVANRNGYGPIELWISGNTQVDMYEVATSLNRLLFQSPKANDALLFMTILSTDLKSLKRRGYNVDRILRQQKTDREAALAEAVAARAKEENVTLMSKPPSTAPSGPPPPYHQPEPTPSGSNQGGESHIKSTVLNSFQNFRKKLTPNAGPDDSRGPPPALPPKPVAMPEPRRNQGVTPTPRSNIASNIDQAVSACRPEHGNLLRNTEHMQQVKEALNEGYCDISGRVGDLIHVGEIGGFKIYLSQEVPSQQTFVGQHQPPLARFVNIMAVLSKIYGLPTTSLHIFYDVAGGLIAFNRNGSIFFNLRYFEAWHNDEVARGNTGPALISWYFTLAHEIAHNLVQPHNSEHEFYFSAICEKHVVALGKALST